MNARRRILSALVGVLLASAAVLAGAPAAGAHPLGNFTVNHYTGITLHPGRVDALVVVDRAEIAAAQERPRIDRDHDGSVDAGEAHRYAAAQCARLADQLRVVVRGNPLSEWRRPRSALSHHPGQAGLETSRLSCALTAAADLRSPAGVTLRTGYDTARIGWHEVTARGEGVTVTTSNVPSSSATDELRRYPQDPLASPLDQRSATLRTEPGGSGTAASAVRSALPGSGPVGTALGKVTGAFDSLVGRHELTVPIGLLALLLAVVLGASHAAMPGHGKTLMAAYLAGRRGTPRDAVTVGVTVTLTHTAGVLVLGLALPLSTGLAGEAVLTWLGLASGLLVTAIGLWLLHSALRGREAGHHHHHHGPGGHHHGPGGHHHGPGGHHHGPRGHHHGPGGHHHGSDGHPHHHGPPAHGPDDHDHLGHAHDHDHDHLGHDHHLAGDHPHEDGTPANGTHEHAPTTPDRLLTIPATAPPHPAPGDTAVLTAERAAPLEGHAAPLEERAAPLEERAAPPRTPTAKAPRASSRRGLIGLGVAGGLVPSPSALVVLLGAVALGRTAFGILLVLAYGLGMAGTLTLAGLLLVRLRDRLDARTRLAAARLAPLRRLARLGPVLTSCLVLVVGAGLTLRACAGPW
ncbi:urease accessory protein UreH domain-containing protein [Streptomyces physcomitrii]|uniref:urease accessory protein UreH domain-containing protein n=1 Tax=Streptomyces physcomitrii TaxID=2724184 RepID=UPI0028A585D6|nr:sulfite exporter TauE/SafE family protein [Streptomyces physcomitrii]